MPNEHPPILLKTCPKRKDGCGRRSHIYSFCESHGTCYTCCVSQHFPRR
jgi:hypothetical protein